MASVIHPLGNLNVPSPEDYRKRKVALISGTSLLPCSLGRVLTFLDRQELLAKMARTCLYPAYLLSDTLTIMLL